MRTENIDIFLSPRAKPSPAASRPGGDATRGGAPGEARQTRERFELPDEARQARQDQAEAVRGNARADEVRSLARRSDDAARSLSGGIGREDAPGRQVMREAHGKRAGEAPNGEGEVVPKTVDLATQTLQVPDLAAPPEGSDIADMADGEAQSASDGIVADTNLISPANQTILLGEDVPSTAPVEIDEADEPYVMSLAQQDAETPPSDAVSTGSGTEESVVETADAVAATVASLVVKPERGMSEAARARQSEVVAARSGVPSGSAPGLAVSGTMAQQNPGQMVGSPTVAVPDGSALDPALGELAADATGEGDGAAALDNPGLRRAFGQLGLASSGQDSPGQNSPGQAAAGQTSGQTATPAAGQAQAQAALGELAQSNPAASQQGLAQALSSLAETGGKAAPTAPPATVPSAPVVPNVPLGSVPIEIGLKALSGVNHFQIRLDPAELGRIDVRLEIETDGTVKAKLTVDRVETLSLLQRDARMLERAFEQAGLKPSDSGVDLSLRDQGREDRRGAPEQGRGDDASAKGRGGGEREAKLVEPVIVQRTIWRGSAGIDVRI